MTQKTQEKHHPKIGKDARGKATFLPNMEYARLLGDKNFKIWHDHYRGKSSKALAKVTIYRVMKAGDLKSPTEFLDLPVREAKKLIWIVINDLMKEGHNEAARQSMSFAKTFYNFHNEKEITFKRHERPKRIGKKVLIEQVPSSIDVYRLSDVALGFRYKDNQKNKLLGLRNRAIILFLWQSGVRVNVLSKLRYKHVKAFVEGTADFQHLRTEFKANTEYWETLSLKMKELPPLFLKVSPELDSKLGSYGLGYYVTFLHHEGFKALKEWLDARKEASGRSLEEEDYVFVVYDFKTNTLGNKPIDPHLVNHMIKVCCGRAGMDVRRMWTHLLRKSFRKVLNTSPIMDSQTAEVIHGHKLPGSQGNYFDYHDILDAARKYMDCAWRSGYSTKINGLSKEVQDQKKTIEKLKEELTRKTVETAKMTRLEKRIANLEARLRASIGYIEKRDQIEEKRINELVKKVAERLKKEG